MHLPRILVGVVLLGSLLLVIGGIDASQASGERRSYTCSFSNGQTWSMRGDRFQREAKDSVSFVISDLNMKTQSAKIVAAGGVSQARVVPALDATHFIELTVGGYMNITTIFDSVNENGIKPAVHSRHLGIVGQPIVSQFVGDCRLAAG